MTQRQPNIINNSFQLIVNGKIKNGRLTPNPIKTIQIENNNGKIPDRAIRNRMSKSIPAMTYQSDIKEELESEN
jgi:hypothetical protein